MYDAGTGGRSLKGQERYKLWPRNTRPVRSEDVEWYFCVIQWTQFEEERATVPKEIRFYYCWWSGFRIRACCWVRCWETNSRYCFYGLLSTFGQKTCLARNLLKGSYRSSESTQSFYFRNGKFLHTLFRKNGAPLFNGNLSNAPSIEKAGQEAWELNPCVPLSQSCISRIFIEVSPFPPHSLSLAQLN